MATKVETRHPTSIRLSTITARQIDELEQAWGEKRADIIARAVQIAWSIEFTEEEKERRS